jgi:lysozyme family protein
MNTNWPNPILTFTLVEEGGFSNDPRDPGGATEHGITLATFRRMTAMPDATIADLQRMTANQEAAIYGAGYWLTVDGPNLPSGVDLMVFDEGVNCGPGESETLAQIAAGMFGEDRDGVIGPKTLAAIGALDPGNYIVMLGMLQQQHYDSLGNFARFGEGWTARRKRRQAAALALAMRSIPP